MGKINTIAFSYKNTPDILKISSSGGAFLGIAKYLFDKKIECNGKIVYGAKWTKDLQVVHGRVDNFDDCKIFCGSKYIQSDLGSSFKDVEKDLHNNNVVLFTGTPCQIAGLKTFLEKKECNTEKLITVDIACHGIPQPGFWNDYKTWLENKERSKLCNFSFRYKPKGWKGYPILAEFENGKRYENSFLTSHYMTIFRKDLLIRSSCFNCTFPNNRYSDITIADFWGVESCEPQIAVGGGVSLILCHTDKGKSIINGIGATEVHDNSYLQFNQNLSRHTDKPINYNQFWNDYNNKGLEYVLKEYGGNSFRGKITFYLKRFLRDLGVLDLGKKLLQYIK